MAESALCALRTPQLLSQATMIACADNNGRIRDYCHRGSEACELARGEPILQSCVLRQRPLAFDQPASARDKRAQ